MVFLLMMMMQLLLIYEWGFVVVIVDVNEEKVGVGGEMFLLLLWLEWLGGREGW